MRVSRKWWVVGLVILSLILTWFFFLGGFIYTPQIGGKIVDAETGDPIAEVNLKVSWEGYTRVIIDTVHTTYGKGFYQTSSKGDFTIPAYRRLLFPFFQAYDRQDIFVYAHGYKPQIIRRFAHGEARLPLTGYPGKAIKVSSNGTIIKLEPLQTDKEWISNIKFLERGIFGLVNEIPEGINFLIKECEIFVEKFPNSPFAPGVLLESADFYFENMDEYPQYANFAIEQYQKVVEKFPGSKEARVANHRLQYIKENPPEKKDWKGEDSE